MNPEIKILDPLQGLSTDNSPIDMPKGTVRFALNSIYESGEGDQASIQNEPGNIECYTLPAGHKLKGSVLLDNNDVVVFSYNSDTIESNIGIVSACVYTTLVSDSCLNFQYPIKGLYRLIKGCERIIYFYDGVNEDKVLNLDDIPSPFSCNLIGINFNFQLPDADIDVVQSGGDLEVGTYYVAAAYVDDIGSVTEAFILSNSIIIYDELETDSHFNIDGGYSLAGGRDAALGAINPTSKAIQVNLTNVDTNFNQVRFYLIRYITGDGETSEGFEVANVTITGSTMSTIISGINVSNDIAVPVGEIAVVNPAYVTSEAMEQSSGRLLRANVTERVRDWSVYQLIANDIQTSYAISEEQIEFTDLVLNDATSTTVIAGDKEVKNSLASLSNQDPKSPHYYLDNLGYLRDEVYAFGIIFKFSDGTTSPAFHIPGRIADSDPRINIATGNSNAHNRPDAVATWDTELLTIVAEGSILGAAEIDERDVRHLGLGIGETVERWKVFNTAIQTQELFGNTSGILAYYETQLPYPDTVDCEGNRIYPIGNIRHHKMPDRTLEFTTRYVTNDNMQRRPMRLLFSNVNIPASIQPDIVGWDIVRANRDDSNKTVLDTGIYFDTLLASMNASPSTSFRFQNPRFNDNGGEVGNLTNIFYGPDAPGYGGAVEGCGGLNPYDVTGAGPAEEYIAIHSIRHKFKGQVPFGTYVKYDRFSTGHAMQSIGGQDTNGDDITNLTANQQRNVFYKKDDQLPDKLNRQITELYGIPANSTVQLSAEPFINATSQEVLVALVPDLDFNDGWTDTADNRSTFFITIKRDASVYDDLGAITYYAITHETFPPTTTGAVAFGGDAFTAALSFRTTFNGVRCTTNGAGRSRTTHRHLISFFTESDINFSLRHTGTQDCALYWPKSFSTLEQYLLGIDDAFPESPLCDNIYLYNDDYSVYADQVRSYFPVPDNFDYCLECEGLFPHRIIYSEVSLDNDTGDAYRTFLANNKKDMPSHAGEISNLVVRDNNNLLVFTDSSLFNIPLNHQTLQTDASTLFIGTGEFLAVPAVEILKTNYGYAGNRGRFNIATTEYGVNWVDQKNGKVYHFAPNSSPVPISNRGMGKWLERNLPSYLEGHFRAQTASDYPELLRDDTTNDYGVGILGTFDPKFDRYIIHKKDYLPLFNYEIYDSDINPIPSDGTFVFDSIGNQFALVSGASLVPLSFSDANSFEDKSWTLSYSLRYGTWNSWHSYHPSAWYYDSNTFFSTASDSNVWRHVERNYQNYYGTKHDHIVEFIANTPQTTRLQGVNWIQNSSIYNSTYDQFVDTDITYDRLMAYNAKQNTGIQLLTDKAYTYDNINWNSFNKKVVRTQRNFKASQMRDLVTDYTIPHLTSSWVDISLDYFIDKVPSIAVSAVKSFYEQQDLVDKWHAIRLYAKPPEDVKMVLDLTGTQIKNSQR